MGEGMGNEALLMPYISSANIACGYHAGNEAEMKSVVQLCIQHQVAIGAHPSFDDKENFGRTAMQLPADEIYDLVKTQIDLLHNIVRDAHGVLHHVKPHGALYNMAAKDRATAFAIAKAVKDTDNNLIFYGLSGSVMIEEADKMGLYTASEVFADRTYQPDGSLTPRTAFNALITQTEAAIQQVMQMIQRKTVTAINNKTIVIKTDTVCIHGDGIHAVEFAKALYHSLQNAGINIQKIKY